MAIELGVEVTRNAGLTHWQIEQVARRINAPEGELVFFSRDGVVLHAVAEQYGTMTMHGEIYSARRVGDNIEYERITSG